MALTDVTGTCPVGMVYHEAVGRDKKGLCADPGRVTYENVERVTNDFFNRATEFELVQVDRFGEDVEVVARGEDSDKLWAKCRPTTGNNIGGCRLITVPEVPHFQRPEGVTNRGLRVAASEAQKVKDFCEIQGKRLPTYDELQYLRSKDDDGDYFKELGFTYEDLEWYVADDGDITRMNWAPYVAYYGHKGLSNSIQTIVDTALHHVFSHFRCVQDAE